jgi:probable F420-dependent oxidoreductase
MTTHAVQLQTRLRNFAEEPDGWDHLIRQAQVLDQAGFDRLSVSDHVVYGEHLDQYGRPEIGGRPGGRQPTGPDGHWLEPLTALTYLAALTSHIRLGTLILLAALRRPVVLAKTVATLDTLSNGRLDLGVGVGWQREEYDVAGLAFEGRGRELDVSLEICQLLWREQRASFHSQYLSFDNIHMMPKPVQRGGVPIWVSGTVNPQAMSRLARFGSAWLPWPMDRDTATLGVDIQQMREELHDRGRDPSEVRVLGSLPARAHRDGRIDIDQTMDAVPGLVTLGVTDLHLELTVPDDPAEALDVLCPLVAAFRSAVGRQP